MALSLQQQAKRRAERNRRRLKAVANGRLRLSVYRSDKNISAQVIDDAQGVTAAFNRNLLVRANAELGADFDLDAFEHLALWNPAESRMEMHLRSIRDQRVTIGETVIAFAKGETIHTESSRKFTRASIAELTEAAGWTVLLFEQSSAPSVALALLGA